MNIINNYKTVYYNILTNFYLVLNLFIPMYNDVIISMNNQATKTLYGDAKKIKRVRMIEFLNELNTNDKLILDKNNNLLVVEYDYSDCIGNDSDSETDDNVKENGQKICILGNIKRLLNHSLKNE